MGQSDYNEDDELAYLYEDVIHTLKSGRTLSGFDLESLTDVYDYACDLSDEFVIQEVMVNVLSRSPRYLPMLERKAVRYFQLSEPEAAETEANRLPANSFIKALICTFVAWDADNWRNGFTKLFRDAKPASINDFGAISLIDTVVATDDLAHLVELLPDIQKCFKYPADFLAEVSHLLIEREYYREATTVLQELTVLESYNAEHWLKLADIYVNKLDDMQEALTSLDYALAIDPESPSAQLLLGDVYLRIGENTDKALQIAERWIPDAEFRKEALYLKAGVYIGLDDNEKALNVLEQYISESVNTLDVFILIFSLAEHGLSKSMSERFESDVMQADAIELERWYAKARQMLGAKQFEVALGELALIDREMPDDIFNAILMHLYAVGKYDECIARYRMRFGKEIEAKSGLLYLFSLLRLGEADAVTISEISQELIAIAVATYKNGTAEDYLVQLSIVKIAFTIVELMKSYNVDSPQLVAEINEIDPFKELLG